MDSGRASPADLYERFNVGINWLLKGHNSKITSDYENRPIFNDQLGRYRENLHQGPVRAAVSGCIPSLLRFPHYRLIRLR